MDKYKEAGVDINAGYESVQKIKKHVQSTNIKGVMSTLGQFCSMFDLSQYNLKEPVLLSGTDGVGTKIKICEMTDDYSMIGEDLVAMSVNDILVHGARPLYFLDYIACAKNDPNTIEQIVKSVASGCCMSNCALVGGETAEMPGVYAPKGHDLAGFVVGVCEKSQIVTSENVKPNDIIIGLPSSGLHSNGYSLVRKVLFEDNNIDVNEYSEVLGKTYKEELLTPTRIYYKEVSALLEANVTINAMAHITGGGYQENIPRCLNGHGAVINTSEIKVPEIFNEVARLGNIPKEQMYNFYNMGIGYVVVVHESEKEKVLSLIDDAIEIGYVTKEEGIKLCD